MAVTWHLCLFGLFFGDKDKHSLEAFEKLRDCGGVANATVFPGVGHFSWARANTLGALVDTRNTCEGCFDSSDVSDGADVWAWLLQQTRKSASGSSR